MLLHWRRFFSKRENKWLPEKYLIHFNLSDSYEFSQVMLMRDKTLSRILPVHGVQHFNCDKDGQSHCHWVRIMENVAVQALELLATSRASQVMSELVVSHLGSVWWIHEPPSGSTNGSGSDVASNSHVTEEEPARDKTWQTKGTLITGNTFSQ